jgi:hypothetical protein
MRHAAIVTSIVLTLMSGFVLSQLWALEAPSSRSIPVAADPHQIEATALGFYQAVNAYLGSGDDASMRRMLHPGFVTNQPGSSWAGTTEDFLRHLDSVRRLYPSIQLEPEAASLGNNIASVTLSVSSQQRREFAGIEIDPIEVVGRLDVVRIERGLIVERWSSAPLAGQLEAYSSLSIDWRFASNTLATRVQEFSLENASEPVTNSFSHLLVIVKSGQALLDVTSQADIPAMIWRVQHGRAVPAAPIEPEMTVTLDSMETVYLPAGTEFRIWDSRNLGTSLIALEFGPPFSREIQQRAPLFEDLAGTLWSGIELEGVGNRLTLSLGHAALLPQATLSSREVEGMELTWVTGGSLEMASSSGEARVRKAGGTRSQLIDGHALLQAGETAAAGPGSNITYQVSGDTQATAWFLSLVPADPGGAEMTPIPTPAPGPNHTPW